MIQMVIGPDPIHGLKYKTYIRHLKFNMAIPRDID